MQACFCVQTALPTSSCVLRRVSEIDRCLEVGAFFGLIGHFAEQLFQAFNLSVWVCKGSFSAF